MNAVLTVDDFARAAASGAPHLPPGKSARDETNYLKGRRDAELAVRALASSAIPAAANTEHATGPAVVGQVRKFHSGFGPVVIRAIAANGTVSFSHGKEGQTIFGATDKADIEKLSYVVLEPPEPFTLRVGMYAVDRAGHVFGPMSDIDHPVPSFVFGVTVGLSCYSWKSDGGAFLHGRNECDLVREATAQEVALFKHLQAQF